MKNFPLIIIGITAGVIISAFIVGQYKEALIASSVFILWLFYFVFLKRKS